jgi:hypothetical protein
MGFTIGAPGKRPLAWAVQGENGHEDRDIAV